MKNKVNKKLDYLANQKKHQNMLWHATFNTTTLETQR